MMYRLFYLKKDDLLMVVFSLERIPNKIVRDGDAFYLYFNDSLVGINIFHFSKIYQLDKEGMILPLDDDLLSAINSYLKSIHLDKIHSGYFVSLIKEVEEVEDSDHLHLVKVSDGKEEITLICGAKNAKVGLKVVLAKEGTILPNGETLKASTIIGYPSHGMLCSKRDLGLDPNDYSHNLIIVEDDYNIGDDYFRS